MYQYELGVIVSTRLDEESQNAALEKVQELITRFGGTIEKVDNWGRRKLAYPIQKQQDGIYSFITFSSEGSAPAEIESRIRIMESVLRFLVIRMDE
ncbi:MAG: 30S ribosomal protein S6 [Defluviitaleaceae bacterium]|nr:30S ribosomal protein S6 [Defluviitaleaceae bacterium]